MSDISCFSVRFCDDSLLVLKNAFASIFFRKQKVSRVFQWQEGVNVVVVIFLLSTKSCLSFLKFYFLAKIFGEMFIMSVKSNSFPKELWIKPFISRSKPIKRNLRHRFVDDNARINVSPNIPCTFLLFKGNACLQVFFSRKSNFWERQFFLIVNVWHTCLFL